jgi:hypothetical protein
MCERYPDDFVSRMRGDIKWLASSSSAKITSLMPNSISEP